MTHSEKHLIFKIRILKYIILLTSFIVAIMAIVRFNAHQYVQMSVDIAMVFIFCMMYQWIQKVPTAYNTASRVILAVGLITVLSAQFYDPRQVWFPTLLLLAFFLRGQKEGLIWMAIVSLSTLILAFAAGEEAGLSFIDLFVLLGDLIFVTLIISWYEHNKEETFNEIKKANSLLEERVKYRTEEVEEARVEAVKALRARSEFLANMSHEIRTPLNAINGFISLLKEDEETPDKQEYFEIIQHASHSLIQTINDILDYSKLESKKAILVNATFDIIELKENIKLFEAKAHEKEITIKYDYSEELPQYLNGDIQKIRQTINNLLSNAIKFTREGGNITCTLSYQNEHLHISIQDDGIGIPEDKLDSIFKPFTQADGSTARKFGGTGLGLSICSSFVEMMGGVLEVESHLNKGSRFFFSLPLKSVERVPELQQEHDTNQNITLQGHILIAEDNKANQLFMGVLLNNLGLTYEIAQDGLEAVEMMEHPNDYTIILMDEHMPHMSGIEATQKILQREKECGIEHIPIIALTANALTGDKEHFIAAGMDDYISKPVNIEDMLRLLKKYTRAKNV